jgi:hypothetical protein
MLLSPLRYINPISGNRGGSAFSIAKSFYLDGVDEYFTIPNADLSSVLQGVVQASFNFTFKFTNDDNFTLWGNGNINRGIFIGYAQSSNFIQMYYYNEFSQAKYIRFPSSAFTVNAWNNATFTIDTTTVSNNKLFVNGAEISPDTSTLISSQEVLTTADDFSIGLSIAGFGNYDGYINQISVIDRVISLSEHQSWYNNGKPKDPQALFGANCKYFFNPDNSGDTAQFSVVDSVNSITATSVNMVDADKTPITPYSDPISDLVTKYGFLNAWSGENVEINGTTTTAKDYASEHDLANPTVASQPTFVGGNADFNNRPIIDFDGIDDQLTKAVANWRSADSSGCFVAVINTTGNYYFSTNDNSSNSSWFSMYKSGLNIHGLVKNGSIMVESTNSFTGANVYGAIGTGVEFKEFINGVDETTNQASYSWLDSLPTQRDDITMGATTRLSNIFANCEVAFIGYLPYTDDATIIACQNELKTIFGI